MKTFFVWIVVLVVLVGGIYWAINRSPSSLLPTQNQNNNQPTNPQPATINTSTTTATSTGVNATIKANVTASSTER